MPRRRLSPAGPEVTRAPAPFPERYVYPARIVSVHDGDTIRAELDLGFEVRATWSLRLLGIQAPEVGGPNVSDAEKVAGVAAREWLDGVLLTIPPGRLFVRTERDRAEGRGRYLAELLAVTDDGRFVNLNEQMVAEGHATPYAGKGRAPKWTPAGWVAGAVLALVGLAGCASRPELPPAQRCRVVLEDGMTWWGPSAEVAGARARWYVDPSWRRPENVRALGYGAP